MNDATDNAELQAKAQYESICDMVAALNCDYARLGEVKDELEALSDARDEIVTEKARWIGENPGRFIDPQDARTNWALAHPDENDRLGEIEDEIKELEDELASLLAEAGDCEDVEQAQKRIQEPLEVQVRGEWHSPGDEDAAKPSEFYILLCTGGPAVRIRGELNRGDPDRAWIEYQDWGTPWTRYFDAEQDVLLAYCREFFFGE